MAGLTSDKSEFQVAPLTRDTLQERVYHQVSDLILDGEIAPGQLVTITGLADAFGVSAMPVREAMKRLAAAGALTLVSGRSMGIPQLNLERLTDLKNVRVEVEGLAAAWAARQVQTNDLEQVASTCADMDKAVECASVKDYLRANRAFHFAVYRMSRSPTLVAMIETLWLQISPYFNLLHGSGNYASANERHREVLTALAARKSREARAAIQADIHDAYAVLSNLLN
jgi:DNA-binding GntR family transcriptional regulator